MIAAFCTSRLLGRITYPVNLASSMSKNSLTLTRLSGRPMLKLCSANMCLNRIVLSGGKVRNGVCSKFSRLPLLCFHSSHIAASIDLHLSYLFSQTFLQKRHFLLS